MLSDDEWAQVACEIMHRTGLAPYGQEDDAVHWAAADTMHAAARALGNTELWRAADAYDRAARLPYGRIPAPHPVGNTLRATARLLATEASATSNDLVYLQFQLMLRLARPSRSHRRPASRSAARRSGRRRPGGGRIHAHSEARPHDAAWKIRPRQGTRRPGRS
jgi:hypothetical protein